VNVFVFDNPVVALPDRVKPKFPVRLPPKFPPPDTVKTAPVPEEFVTSPPIPAKAFVLLKPVNI
jgi:hypothetical protein